MRRIKVLSPWWGTAGGTEGPGGVAVQILMGFNTEKEKHLAVGEADRAVVGTEPVHPCTHSPYWYQWCWCTA